MYKFIRNCLIIFILYTLSKNIKSEYDMFLIQDSIEQNTNDSVIVKNVKKDIIFEILSSRNIKNKNHIVNKVKKINITIYL